MQDFLLNLSTVLQQVLVLFFLILLGFVSGKIKLLNDTAVKVMSDFCLKLVTPAVIIKSFVRKFDAAMGTQLLLALLGAVICHIIALAVGTALFRNKNDLSRRAIYRNSTLLSNAGFMAIPLQLAILGDNGTFFGATYIVVLTVFIWTYAYATIGRNSVKISVKTLILNPGIIATVIGVPLFLFSVNLPDVITTSITHVANLNTPLPMIIVGYYLANSSLKSAFSDKKAILVIVARILIAPALCLAALYLLGFRGEIFISTIIAASAPIAVAVTMFAAKFDADTELSSNLVSVSTLFSILTMPVLIAFAETIA